jgi:thiol-disulfide isomerase/thioredoxin
MTRQRGIVIARNRKTGVRSWALCIGVFAVIAVGVAFGATTAKGTKPDRWALPPVTKSEATPAAMVPIDEATPDSSTILNLEAYKGKVVYLDFWASWCVPCRKSFPWMNAMQAKYEKDGLVVIGVNVDRDAKAAQKFLKKAPADFNIVYDPEGKLASQYELEAMPSSFLYRRDGTLHESHLGFRDDDRDTLERMIQTLLQEKTDTKKTD